MAIDLLAPAQALMTILSDIGVDEVHFGAPESYNYDFAAYVTLGGFPVFDKTTGPNHIQWEQRYFIDFAYRVSGDEGTAETALCSYLVDLVVAILVDRTLGGVVSSTSVDGELADDPIYRRPAGEERREFPILVTTVQRYTLGT